MPVAPSCPMSGRMTPPRPRYWLASLLALLIPVAGLAADVTGVGIAATPHAPGIPGPKPLEIPSHGNGGSDLGHHDLATYLASHGFMVATLNHLGDYFRDTSSIGVAGFSAGGYTSRKTLDAH